MKKPILTAAICLILCLGGGTTAIYAQVPDTTGVELTQVKGEQDLIPSGDVPSEAVDYIEESQIAHRMTQAEKAENARVNDSWGGAITIIAMAIVISVLAILSILFLIFGKISAAILSKNKKASSERASAAGRATDDSHEVDTGDVIAAIGMALSEHFGDGHDMEDTILTIRRLNRAYSPWNSKIYNLRKAPELNRQNPNRSAF